MHVHECVQLRALVPARERVSYYRGRFAVDLLRGVVGEEGVRVSELRRSRLGRLLSQDPIRDALAVCGDGVLRHEALDSVWRNPIHFWKDYGVWRPGVDDDWQLCQLSRPGVNLVVHLNFPGSHERLYRETTRTDRRPFTNSQHPGSRTDRTLAWARVDINATGRCALIEELQTDWLRLARARTSVVKAFARTGKGREAVVRAFGEPRRDFSRLEHYLRGLEVYEEIWSEALLATTLESLRALGVQRVWMHTPESGALYKCILEKLPPRSLYTRLPRRFCFESDVPAPRFIEAARAAVREPTGARMWCLDL